MSLDRLPDGLPVPVDDGAADHLLGNDLPDIERPTAQGATINLAIAGTPWLVLYVYPMTGRPDVALPDDWEMIPGARGCTPQTCAFRDHQVDLAGPDQRPSPSRISFHKSGPKYAVARPVRKCRSEVPM